jgi:hypothetical protein
MALEARDAGDADEPDDDDLGHRGVGGVALVPGRDEAGEASREGVVADLGDLLVRKGREGF